MKKLAKLAMLNEKDASKLRSDINEIIEMAKVLSEVEREDCFYDKEGNFKVDKAEKSMDRNMILSNAPCVEEGYIIVPKVMD